MRDSNGDPVRSCNGPGYNNNKRPVEALSAQREIKVNTIPQHSAHKSSSVAPNTMTMANANETPLLEKRHWRELLNLALSELDRAISELQAELDEVYAAKDEMNLALSEKDSTISGLQAGHIEVCGLLGRQLLAQQSRIDPPGPNSFKVKEGLKSGEGAPEMKDDIPSAAEVQVDPANKKVLKIQQEEEVILEIAVETVDESNTHAGGDTPSDGAEESIGEFINGEALPKANLFPQVTSVLNCHGEKVPAAACGTQTSPASKVGSAGSDSEEVDDGENEYDGDSTDDDLSAVNIGTPKTKSITPIAFSIRSKKPHVEPVTEEV